MSEGASLKKMIISGSNSQSSSSQEITSFLSSELSIWSLDLNTVSPMPNLNNEMMGESTFPHIIKLLLEKMSESQMLLFVYPQYNYNLSGFFKNVLDWCSLHSSSVFYGKSMMLVGCSSTEMGEEEFKSVSTITFSSLGAEEIFFLNTTEKTNLSELVTKLSSYV